MRLPDFLPEGTRVMVHSAVLGDFIDEIAGVFYHAGHRCYALKEHRWIYEGEAKVVMSVPKREDAP